MTKELFKRVYDAESLYDLDRDMSEALDPVFNDKLCGLPVDEFNYYKGGFTVQILWDAPEEDA